MKNKKILDLQIFLTRTPGEQVFKYEGLPSFTISGEAQQIFQNFGNIRSDSHNMEKILNHEFLCNTTDDFEKAISPEND